MSRAIRRSMFCLMLAVISASAPSLSAQDTKSVTPGPVPPQIASAKKVFVANVPGDIIPASIGGTDRSYNEFYAAMKSSGEYELVSSPADADLVLEISITHTPDEPLLRLVILDLKTRVPLWCFGEPVIQKSHIFGHEKATDAFDDARFQIVDDLKRLRAAPAH